MKNVLIILFLIITIHCNAQDKTMIITDESGAAYTSYDGPTKKISSFSELPFVIQLNINGYLKRILGSMSDSIQFTHGQEVDLKALFKKDSITFNYFWVRPKYDLNFKLSDSSIGIKRYNLKLRLDEYGQLLDVNWPRQKYNDKSKFLSREKIKQFALKHAKMKRYDTSTYLIFFGYDSALDKLCWKFMFLDSGRIRTRYNDPVKEVYNVVFIDWNELRIIREFQSENYSIS